MSSAEVQLFFRAVLGRQEGLVCLAALERKNKKLHEAFFLWPTQEQELLDEIEKIRLKPIDIYFCPQLFNPEHEQRNKDNVITTPCAWADLDGCAPDKLLIEPTVLVESSPGRYHAYWSFERTVEPEEAEDLSRRIAYKHADQGADRSGWDLTQLLRVPGTFNYKYDEPIPVKLVKINRTQYRLSDFEAYPEVKGYTLKYDEFPTELNSVTRQDAEQLLEDRRGLLNKGIWDLFENEPQVPSWSEVLWRFLMMLFEAKYTKTEVYTITTFAKCNKYARDNKEPIHLWREVNRAAERFRVQQQLLVSKPELIKELLTDSERNLVEAAGETVAERYIRWAASLGDAATQYHQAGAFIILSSLLCGDVNLPTSYGTIYPNIWFMILADSTITRKSTAMDVAMDLLDEVDDEAIMATDGSIEGLMSALSVRPGRPSVFLRDEFSGLLASMSRKDYLAGMAEMLTKLYDGKLQRRILRKETVEVRDPRLIIFAGGIKTRILSLMNLEMISSGFVPRFVFITAESDLTRLKPIGPPTEVNTTERDNLIIELTDMAKHYSTRTETITVEKLKTQIIRRLPTDATLTPEAWDRYNALEYKFASDAIKHPRPDVLAPLGDRLAKSILKIAVLIAASRQRGEVVQVELVDILRAIKYGEQWHAHASTVLEGVGISESERQLELVAKIIDKNPIKGVSRSMIMQSYHLSARDASQLFDTLEQRGRIRRQRSGRAEVFYPNVNNEPEDNNGTKESSRNRQRRTGQHDTAV